MPLFVSPTKCDTIFDATRFTRCTVEHHPVRGILIHNHAGQPMAQGSLNICPDWLEMGVGTVR